MVVARNLSTVKELVVDQTTFLIRTLPHRVMLRMEGMNQADVIELVVRAGCAGWRDFADSEGNVIASALDEADGKMISGVTVRSALSELSYEALPLNMVNDVAEAVLKFNRLSSDDSGN
jgi:hypothetical protein